MQRSILLPALSALALLACRDTPRAEGRPGAGPAQAGPESRAGGEPFAEGIPRGNTPIEIRATVDGREVASSGMGECEHAAEGSIYQRPAALWTARFDGAEGDAIRHLSLSFWREKTGAESVTLGLQTGATVHQIATVPGGERKGSGTARLDGDASAGTLVVEGTTAEGTRLRLEARCARFTTLVAEGG